MRLRLPLLLLLCQCLLFSQQAALAHGISHIRVGDGRAIVAAQSLVESLSSDQPDDFCIECLAFAQVTGAAPAAAAELALPAPVSLAPPPLAEHRVASAAFLSFRARAPPSITR